MCCLGIGPNVTTTANGVEKGDAMWQLDSTNNGATNKRTTKDGASPFKNGADLTEKDQLMAALVANQQQQHEQTSNLCYVEGMRHKQDLTSPVDVNSE